MKAVIYTRVSTNEQNDDLLKCPRSLYQSQCEF
jgi:DNA invertase Pin-like site-specific DNA recombinase